MPKPFHGRGAPTASEAERHLRAVIRSQHLQMEQQQADKMALLDEIYAVVADGLNSNDLAWLKLKEIINRERKNV